MEVTGTGSTVECRGTFTGTGNTDDAGGFMGMTTVAAFVDVAGVTGIGNTGRGRETGTGRTVVAVVETGLATAVCVVTEPWGSTPVGAMEV